MKSTLNENTRPYAVVHLSRDDAEQFVYRVTSKAGRTDIPNLFGKIHRGSRFIDEEFLYLGFEWKDFDGYMEFSLFSTNFNAIGITQVNQSFHGENLIRIARFLLTPTQRACIPYGDDAIILELTTENLTRLSVRIFKDLCGNTEILLNLYEKGLIGKHCNPIMSSQHRTNVFSMMKLQVPEPRGLSFTPRRNKLPVPPPSGGKTKQGQE